LSFINYFGLFLVVIFLTIIIYKKQIKNIKKPEINTLFTEALNFMVRGDKSKAISLLKDVVKNDSNHIAAYLQLGNILRSDNPEKSIKIHQSLTVRPQLSLELKVDIHRALAMDYEAIGQMQKAKKEVEQILKIEKRNLWALSFLITLSEFDQEWDKAALYSKQLQKITGKKDTDSLAQFEIYKGLEKLEDGLINEAELFFKKSIKVSSEYAPGYFYLGNVYEKKRDLAKAIESWELYAIKDLKNNHKVFSQIESALFDLGRYSEVEKFYKRILDFDSEHFQAIIRLANVLEEKGEREQAISLLDNSLIQKKGDIRTDLMKIKLLIPNSTPTELAQQIDVVLEKLLVTKFD
jgi:lipopolysaccharide biosynthesis regulator YciM